MNEATRHQIVQRTRRYIDPDHRQEPGISRAVGVSGPGRGCVRVPLRGPNAATASSTIEPILKKLLALRT
jgi:hypothetical protein